jgi:stearoyl-CoA desaturase (delta-9 desaturase)
MNLYKLRIIWISGIVAWLFSIAYGFNTGEWHWPLIAFLVSKIISVPAHHIAMHRYFAHRSFVTTRSKHKFLCWISVLLGAGNPVLYATSHRHHHQFSDEELDLHSPKNNILYSLGLWEIKPFEWFKDVKKVRTLPKDIIRDPDVQFIYNHYFKIWAGIAFISILLGVLVSWKIPVFMVAAPLGWYIFGAGVFANTLNHKQTFGSYRNFTTPDDSQNNKWINWYTLGEGLHNNHHARPSAYNQAILPGEFDFAGWCIEKFFALKENDPRIYRFK